MIQGIQGQPHVDTMAYSTAVYSILHGFGEQNVDVTVKDSETVMLATEPSISIQLGIFTSFSEAGRQLADTFTLN